MTRMKVALIAAGLLAFCAGATYLSFFGLPWSHPGKRYFEQKQFTTGINYPWLSYGNDFGLSPWGHLGISEPANSVTVENDFAKLQSIGVTVVRWFVFGDTRSGLQFDLQGRAIGMDPYVFPDIQTAVDIAHRHNIKLIFVLIDFSAFDRATFQNGHQLGGRSDIVTDPVKRQSFLDNVVKPLLQKFGTSEDIIDWEVINEPEWAMDIPSSMLAGMVNRRLSSFVNPRIKTADMQNFVCQVVDYIHKYSTQGATVGSATRGWVFYWRQCKLDVYQIHYYPWMEVKYPYNSPAAILGLDKPVLVGEFPTKKGIRSTLQYLELAHANGYAGGFAWSMHATDPYTSFKNAEPQINQFTHSLAQPPTQQPPKAHP